MIQVFGLNAFQILFQEDTLLVLCGVATKTMFTTYNDIARLGFFSDSVTNKAGFNITYAQYEGKIIKLCASS